MGEVSNWIPGIRRDEGPAQQRLWEHYFPQVLNLARQKLGACGLSDAEEVAASALDSLLQGARAGRFSLMSNRHDLWTLLFGITHRKIVNRRRYNLAKKRAGGVCRGDLDHLPGDVPSPEFEAVFRDLVSDLFGRLPNDELRRLARLRLEGWTNLEIADQLEVTVRTVERKLQLIRAIWTRSESLG